MATKNNTGGIPPLLCESQAFAVCRDAAHLGAKLLPPHVLRLRVGHPVMLLRTMDVTNGRTNHNAFTVVKVDDKAIALLHALVLVFVLVLLPG